MPAQLSTTGIADQVVGYQRLDDHSGISSGTPLQAAAVAKVTDPVDAAPEYIGGQTNLFVALAVIELAQG